MRPASHAQEKSSWQGDSDLLLVGTWWHGRGDTWSARLSVLCGTMEGAPECMAPGPRLTFRVLMASTTALRLEVRARGNSAPCTDMTTIRMNLSGHKCESPGTQSAGSLPRRNRAHLALASSSPNLALITVPSLHCHCLFCSRRQGLP